eukprot:Phypoly_transcript_05240.p1 GENE.Phypoly_transcript_05240~~Phypoly_transcript_05240.p1  ORF type:complete len:473 (+),score=81.43 Phypoly_transcript_05240:240-1658(+)
MESESSSVAPSLGLPSKLDTANVYQSYSYSQPSLAPFNTASYQSSTPYSSLHFQSPNDLFDSSKSNIAMNTPRNNMENSSLQSLQSRLIESNKLANASSSQDKISIPQSSSSGMSSGPVSVNGGPGTPSTPHQSFAYDERFHALYEREIRWNEVRRYIDKKKKKKKNAAHMELTKDTFYDLYNMALQLLKSVDSLDPDKSKKSDSAQYFPQMTGAMTQSAMITQMAMQAQPLTDADLLNQRKSYDMYGMRGQSNSSAFDGATYLSSVPKYAALPTDQNIYASYPQGQDGLAVSAYASSMQMGSFGQAQSAYMKSPSAAGGASTPTAEAKNFTGEVFFDDVGQGADGNRPKRRRRRHVYSSRRNLHCHMCGVTETPEWRRGPAGDHTLCNACGLHYAKSLKKQRKEQNSRKHSIDMLLNENQQQPALPPNTNNNNVITTNGPIITSPMNGNHSSPGSSQEDMTPPNDLLSPNQ